MIVFIISLLFVCCSSVYFCCELLKLKARLRESEQERGRLSESLYLAEQYIDELSVENSDLHIKLNQSRLSDDDICDDAFEMFP